MDADLYESDFYAWANEQAALLRSGNLSAADIANIAEEIETLGRSEKRELVSRLAILFLHLLKWQHQPERRGRSWRASIVNSRRALASHIRDNPSLKSKMVEAVTEAYEDARQGASGETDLPLKTFPAVCPWTYSEAMAFDIGPEE